MKLRTRVKICGFTRTEDLLEAARLGVDAVGFVFYAKSPRAVDCCSAQKMLCSLPAFVTSVGLFVDPQAQEVEAVIREVGVDLLQFHGDEDAAFCASFERPYIKAVRMRENVDLDEIAAKYVGARALLLDAYQSGTPGGTGQSFDWARVPPELSKPVILAGGLDATNVSRAISQVRPFAVDVSGGVESHKGVKDSQKMQEFMKGVDDVNRE